MGAGAAVAGGLMSMSSSRKAGKQSAAAAAQAEEQYAYAKANTEESKAIADQFATDLNTYGAEYSQWTQDNYDKMNGMFGDMRQNLVDYYDNLDPTKYATQYKADINTAMQNETKRFDQTMAQSGIYTSGMKAQALKDSSFKQAELNAGADLGAEEHVMGMKEGFYGQYGDQQLNQANQQVGQGILNQANMGQMGVNAQTNARSQSADMAMNQAGGYMDSSAGYGKQQGTQMGSGLKMFGSGMTGLFG